MKLILFLIAFTSPLGALSQTDTIRIRPKDVLSIKFDSVNISIWDIYFKELSSPDDEFYPSKKLVQHTLTQAQANSLMEQLKNEGSYDGGRANLSHHDIEINFFLNGKKTLEIEVSAMTGNIDIQNRISEYSFRNNCSTTFGKSLLSMLEDAKLLEIAEYDEIDVEGLMN